MIQGHVSGDLYMFRLDHIVTIVCACIRLLIIMFNGEVMNVVTYFSFSHTLDFVRFSQVSGRWAYT